MKINEIPEEYKSRVDFTCKTCRNKFRTEKGKNSNCAWRACGGEICVFVEEAIEQTEREKKSP